jgi:hypothetical protein
MRLCAAFFLLASLAAPAAAQEPAYLVFGAGATGVFRHNEHVQDTVGLVSLEYRSGRELFGHIKPLAGAFATSDGGAYVHAGLYRDFSLSSRWIFTPHFSAGIHGHGSKIDLGDPPEFQTGLDLFYRLHDGWRAGITLRHVSNGGAGDFNPGIETVALLVSLPLR